jgi:hypothetical protein
MLCNRKIQRNLELREYNVKPSKNSFLIFFSVSFMCDLPVLLLKRPETGNIISV